MDWMRPGALREAKIAAFEAGKRDRKCGTCLGFQVRPNEVEIAQAARPMAYCGPGRHCFGGPVRGRCSVHGQMKESTQLCGHYRAGGPDVRGVGSMARRGGQASDDRGEAQSWTESLQEAVTTEGNLLALGVTGILALGAILIKDVKWARQQTEKLPFVEDREGLRYPYELVPGGDRVTVYLPVGRKVDHHVTTAATRDAKQLSMEVSNIVVDNYESLD